MPGNFCDSNSFKQLIFIYAEYTALWYVELCYGNMKKEHYIFLLWIKAVLKLSTIPQNNLNI